jgi:hypothetical protein
MIDQLVILLGYPLWIWILAGAALCIVALIVYNMAKMGWQVILAVLHDLIYKSQNDNRKTESSGRKGK